MTTAETSPIDILLVEDNPGDVRLTREALSEGRVHNKLVVVGDGAEALAYLRRRGPYAEVTRPNLVLLDLNLPKVSGFEVLERIKGDPRLSAIPVIVLTSSKGEEDIARAYAASANAYITKPVRPSDFFAALRAFDAFWLSIVRLPTTGRP